MPFFTQLPNRAAIGVSGPEARDFLQGVLSVNMRMLSGPRYGLLLTPQGRFLHDYFLTPMGDGLHFEVAADRAADFMARLKAYKLRAKAEIAPLPDVAAFAVWDTLALPPAPNNVIAFADPRYAPLGFRIAGAEAAVRGWIGGLAEESSAEAYNRHRLALGIPEAGADLIPDKSLPLECGLDALNAVDFDKGCYVGQEVTARTKFRAHIRKRLYCIIAAQGALPASGTAVMAGEKAVGELRSVQGSFGLALLNSETLAAEIGPLTAGETVIKIHFPPWAST